MIDDKQLKKILSDLEIIPAEELDLAEGEAKIKKQPLGEILVEKDLISDKHLG